MELNELLCKIIETTLMLFGLFTVMFIVIYSIYLAGKKQSNNDLKYLAFLIENSTIDYISSRNIQSMIDDYSGRDVDNNQLELLKKRFTEKFGKLNNL
jgi:hypothetical protein